MRSFLQTCLLLILSFITSYSQVPNIQWQKSLGGSGKETAEAVRQTTDGGYIVAGYSSSNSGDVTGNHGVTDAWIVKLNKTGAVQWQKTYGGTGADAAYSIQQTPDGGYVFCGWTASNDGDVSGNHGGNDYWVVKLNSSGGIQWQKCFGGSGDDLGLSIQLTAQRGYIVAGYSRSNDGNVIGNHGGNIYGDAWVIKLDSSANITWSKAVGGTLDDYPSTILGTLDGGYIMGGFSNSNDGDVNGNHGDYDYWVVKMTAAGNIQWQKTYGGASVDLGACLAANTDSTYIIAGYTNSNDGDVTGNHGDYDYWVAKLGKTGSIIWSKCYGGTSGEYASKIAATSDGGYIINGHSNSNDGDVTGNHASEDVWLIKINSSGIKQWESSFGGAGDDRCFDIRQTTDNGYIFTGPSNSDSNDVSGNHGDDDYWVVKLAPDAVAGPRITIAANTGVTICEEATVTLTANVVNAGVTIAYQWKKNNVNVGSNSATYVDSTLKNGDSVLCTVTTAGSTANSNKLKFKVNPNVTPAATITASPGNIVCAGAKIRFNGSVANGGTSPVYKWLRNGVKVGLNDSTYVDSIPKTGDSVALVVTSNATCLAVKTGSSNVLVIKVDVPAPAIKITADKDTNICSSNVKVTFTAHVTPSYLWQKNGVAVGTNSATYIDSTLKTNDDIQCKLVSAAQGCNNIPSDIINSNVLAFKVNTPPVRPSAITGPTSVKAHQTGIHYSVTEVAGVTYAWVLPTGALIDSGQGSNKIIVTWGTDVGVVSVTAINSCGGSPARTKGVLVSSSLSAGPAVPYASKKAVLADNDIHLSPNPARSVAVLTFTATTAGKYAVTIADAQNNVVELKNGTSTKGVNTMKINIAGYARGVYFVTIASKEDGIKIKQLIVGE